MGKDYEITRAQAQRAAASLMVVVGLAATFLVPALSDAARRGITSRLRPSASHSSRAATSSTSVGKLQAVVEASPNRPSAIARLQSEVGGASSGSGAVRTRTVLQIGAFRSAANAHRLKRRLGGSFSNVEVSSKRVGGVRYFRVRVESSGGEDSLAQAETDLRTTGFNPLRIAAR